MKKIIYYKYQLYYMLKQRVKLNYKKFTMIELQELAAAAIKLIDELTGDNINLKSELRQAQNDLNCLKNEIEKGSD